VSNRHPVASLVVLNALGIVANGLAALAGVYLAPSRSLSDAHLSSEPGGRVVSQSLSTVRVPAGTLTLSPDDWESIDKIEALETHVSAFKLDRFEVTNAQWQACRSCDPLTAADGNPRAPAVKLSPIQAEVFCAQHKGRLPTRHEWVFAASTEAKHRYPWGQTGLVCRNVVFGMVNGPCAFNQSAQAPGSRPHGATPNGIFDLSGNVAEWVRDGERFVAVGGSFRSTLAGQLKVWAAEETELPRDDIGFRCAYTEN
jgi:formylglycine-generating enzyme required for sulfatase activity